MVSNLEEVEARLKALEDRCQILEDIESIKKLRTRYCNLTDDGDAQGVANLFTEDGVWEAQWGRYKGREEIKGYVQGGLGKGRLSLAIHGIITPYIEVKGDKAKATWYLLQSSILKKDDQAIWGTGRYEDEYVRINGEWKFKKLHTVFFYWTPYAPGWVKKEHNEVWHY